MINYVFFFHSYQRKIEQSERKLERALSMKEKDGSAEVERALSEKEKTAHEISRDAEKRLQEQISVASEVNLSLFFMTESSTYNMILLFYINI